jgi:hypothetical protein
MNAPATVTEIMAEGTWNPVVHPSTTEFRFPSDDEAGAVIESLATVIGDQASRPSVQRRAVICRKTGEVLLVVACPARWISAGDVAFVAAPEPGQQLNSFLAVEQRAFSPAEALALLVSPESPERELERRGALVRRRDELRAQLEAAAAKRDEAELDAEARARRFHAAEWAKLPLTVRVLYSLALRLEISDAELAAAIHDIAGDAEHLRCPTTEWWRRQGQRAE